MYVAIRNRSCESRSNGWTSWSLARGAIDCAVGGVLSGNINQWYEVADVLFLLPMGWDFQAHVMDLHTWRELEEERQIILTQVFQEAESAFWKMASELTATGISCNTGEVEHCNTGNLGQMSLRELASDEYSEFKRGFVRQSVLPTWVEQCGPDCADLFNATIAQAVGIKAESFAGPTPTPTRQPVPLPTRTRLPTATPTPSPTPTFAGSPTPAPVPQVFFAGAEFVSEGNHGQRITVPVGSKVQVYVTLESNTATVGQLEVHIVSDITLTNDETKRLCGSKVSLEAGLNEILACDFVADQLAGSSLRQYFLKVQWNDDFIYDPQDPETREAVITVPSPTPTPTLFGANAEYQNVITAVASMMADNNISSLPNPSSLTTGNGTGGCDTGTSLMTAFPDATSVIAVDKVLDPDGGTYVEGVDPLGDKAGFLLFSHDHVAGNDQVSLVNYMSVGSTVFCYQSTADGTITQFDMHGTQTNP